MAALTTAAESTTETNGERSILVSLPRTDRRSRWTVRENRNGCCPQPKGWTAGSRSGSGTAVPCKSRKPSSKIHWPMVLAKTLVQGSANSDDGAAGMPGSMPTLGEEEATVRSARSIDAISPPRAWTAQWVRGFRDHSRATVRHPCLREESLEEPLSAKWIGSDTADPMPQSTATSSPAFRRYVHTALAFI